MATREEVAYSWLSATAVFLPPEEVMGHGTLYVHVGKSDGIVVRRLGYSNSSHSLTEEENDTCLIISFSSQRKRYYS